MGSESYLEALARAWARSHGPSRILREHVRAYEMFIIVNAWESHRRNITKTAEALGTSRTHVRRILRRWRSSRLPVRLDERPA